MQSQEKISIYGLNLKTLRHSLNNFVNLLFRRTKYLEVIYIYKDQDLVTLKEIYITYSSLQTEFKQDFNSYIVLKVGSLFQPIQSLSNFNSYTVNILPKEIRSLRQINIQLNVNLQVKEGGFYINLLSFLAICYAKGKKNS